MKKVLVADIMTRSPIFVLPETDLLSCAKKMIQKRTGSLLLVSKNKLVGIISRKDILWALVKKSRKDLSKIRAIDISPRKIATIKPIRSLDYAIKKMKKVKLARLPVINKGELVGLITVKDIFHYNPEIFPEMMEYNQIREWEEKEKRLKKAGNRDVMEGICSECGNQDILIDFNGVLICESCADSLS